MPSNCQSVRPSVPPSRRRHTGNDDEFGFSGAKGLERGLVAEYVFARLHNKRQARVDAVGAGLLGLLGGCRTFRFVSESLLFPSRIGDTHPSL